MAITYECEICLNVNHSVKLHCSTCGTMPAKYSVLRVPTRMLESESFVSFIPVVKAIGCDRAEHHKTSKVILRTVKADYYADSEKETALRTSNASHVPLFKQLGLK